ncbi:MAG: hypothetical protein ACOYEV_05435 [Candidatus Nanopelagicales bacterium]
MKRFVVLSTLALLTVLEVGSWVLLRDNIGPLAVVMVLLLDMIVGIAIMRWGALSQPPERVWRITGGAIIAFPGLVLDLVGVALIVPATRRLITGSVQRKAEEAVRRSGMSVVTVTGADGSRVTTVMPGDVIAGEVIADDAGAGVPPQPQSREVRKEILSGEIIPPSERPGRS